MDWLNYHHLYYFWSVATEGTVSEAAKKLHLARPTVTAQIRELENAVGQKLFQQRGRRLELTEFGQQIYRYAEEIFSIGRELREFVKTGQSGNRKRFRVGIPDLVPKSIAFRLLRPALRLEQAQRTIFHEGSFVRLLADLTLHKLDLVLSDTPAPDSGDVQAYSHKLGECGTSLLAVKELAELYSSEFPSSLANAPMLLPTESSTTRRLMERWFDEREIFPDVVAEFDDIGLLKVFGQAGEGIFPVPSAIEKTVIRQFGVQLVGRVPEVTASYYAITVEKRVEHEATRAILQQAVLNLSGISILE